MTIKPVISGHAANKRGTNADAETDAAGLQAGHCGQVVDAPSHAAQNLAVSQRVAASHRGVVLDARGQHAAVPVARQQSPHRRSDNFDERSRRQRSPHKSRSKRRDLVEHHHQIKRERVERLYMEKHMNAPPAGVSSSSALGQTLGNSTCAAAGIAKNVVCVPSSSTASLNKAIAGNKSPEHALAATAGGQNAVINTAQVASSLLKALEEKCSGYNSGDEHIGPREQKIGADEWQRRDEQFIKCMSDRGYIVKPVEEDGACLFRSISLQIYGDEDMHDVIRQNTMDYIFKNREYFSQFVTEDINSYIIRKRRQESHGNHIEIQAMSEIYNRPVELYSYKPTPVNIFSSAQRQNGYAPLRLSYQRNSHYNAIIDPYEPTVGVGLGLAGYKPDLPTKEAALLSEQLEIEQTMFEDKLKTTDWEATNEAIEEQIARESYLQWCRENARNQRSAAASATVTSGDCNADNDEAAPSTSSNANLTGGSAATKAANALEGANLATEHLKLSASSNDYESDDTSSNGSFNDSDISISRRSFKLKGFGKTMRNMKKRRFESGSNVAALDKENTKHGANSGGDVNKGLLKTEQRNDFKQHNDDQAELAEQPCTSKQIQTPTKCKTAWSESDTSEVNSDTSPEKSPFKNTTSISNENNTETNYKIDTGVSDLYQELLQASYGDDAFGHSTESEMLARALQMSTYDYIEDQKRKYVHND